MISYSMLAGADRDTFGYKPSIHTNHTYQVQNLYFAKSPQLDIVLQDVTPSVLWHPRESRPFLVPPITSLLDHIDLAACHHGVSKVLRILVAHFRCRLPFSLSSASFLLSFLVTAHAKNKRSPTTPNLYP